ncbi:MAG TPA: AMP-binding protein [Solirubrobacteraceae bacterium]|nr:AMP-binding protein [Solirubrobacteraceae bacterium]
MIESWLERAAPDRVAVEAPDGRLTYAELLTEARDQARGLKGRVELDARPGLAFVVRLHACLLAGARAVPVDPRLSARERAALGDAPGDLVVHTSGTTGTPRPVGLTMQDIEVNARGAAVVLGLSDDERWLCPLPLSHVGGLMVLLRSAVYGTTAILGPPDTPGVSLISLVPTQLARLLDAGAPPPSRAVLLGGAPADPTLLTRARDARWPVAPSYGLTQTCSAATIGAIGDTETSGRAIPGVTVTIAPDQEIVVTTATRTVHTGDLGRLDERGRLIVAGRKTDTIVTGGENVAPTEVEAVLRAHPAVADAGVFARPHAEWGEAVTARVVLRPGAEATGEELRAFAAERLARFKVPKAVEVADDLPRTESGKLLRRELA